MQSDEITLILGFNHFNIRVKLSIIRCNKLKLGELYNYYILGIDHVWSNVVFSLSVVLSVAIYFEVKSCFCLQNIPTAVC